MNNTSFKCKVLAIPHNYILSLFTNNVYDQEYIIIPKIRLPENTQVNNVWYEPARRAFMFLLINDEWEPIEEGTPAPEIVFDYETMVKLVRTEIDNYDRQYTNNTMF